MLRFCYQSVDALCDKSFYQEKIIMNLMIKLKKIIN